MANTKRKNRDEENKGAREQENWDELSIPYLLLPALPHRETLNCAPANMISPEMYAQNSRLTEM